MSVPMTDMEMLNWLTESLHVLCYDSGQWFCAWRGEAGQSWIDRPMANTPREAIQAAWNETKEKA